MTGNRVAVACHETQFTRVANEVLRGGTAYSA